MKDMTKNRGIEKAWYYVAFNHDPPYTKLVLSRIGSTPFLLESQWRYSSYTCDTILIYLCRKLQMMAHLY